MPWKFGKNTLKPGDVCIIRTRIGEQRLTREHCLTYLGQSAHGELVFNARPIAGTQSFSESNILELRVLGHVPRGRDPQHHYMNRVVRS